MRKSTEKIIFILLTIVLLVGIVRFEYINEIKIKEPAIYFQIGEEILQGWKKEDVYYLFLPSFAELSDTVLTNYSPEFYVLEEGKTIQQGESLKGLPMEKEISCQMVKSKERFCLYLIQSKNLPAVFLETNSGSLEEIKADKEYRASGNIRIVDEKGVTEGKYGLSSIGGRGNTSFAGYEKKPYSITLQEEASLLGLPSGREYSLLSNASDPSLLRNDLVRRMEEVLELRYSHQGKFVDLYINGIYEGNYYLCDDIKIGTERIPITDMEAAMDLIYNTGNYESEKLYETGTAKARELSVALKDITGGYLLEREYSQRYNNEYEEMKSGFITKNQEHFVVKSPAYCSVEQIEYIKAYMEEVEAAILDPKGKNPETELSYTEYIDIHSFVKKYLVEEISKNYDGGVSSSYYYKDSSAVDGKLYAGPGWDYDMSLGNYVEWMEEFSADPTGISKLSFHTYASFWYESLYEKEKFIHLVQEYYKNKLSPFLHSLVTEQIEEAQELLSYSAKMNEIRWKEELMKNPYFISREESYKGLKEFIRERTAYLDQAWK